jgi:hypothetical protein
MSVSSPITSCVVEAHGWPVGAACGPTGSAAVPTTCRAENDGPGRGGPDTASPLDMAAASGALGHARN